MSTTSACGLLMQQELKAAKAAQAKADAEAKAQAKAEAKADATLTKTRSKETHGGHVWIRNENLTVRVGALPRGWEKKIDPVGGNRLPFVLPS